jgi:hypothetical protein
MKNIFIFLGVLLLFTFSACKSTKKSTEKSVDVLYGMKKGPCFGECPVYELNINSAGLAKLDAKRFNKINGKLEKMLSVEEMAVLKMAFKNANLASLENDYKSVIEDFAKITLSHFDNDVLKVVRGNEQMSDDYKKAVALMEGIARSNGWEVKEKYPEEIIEPEVREAKPEDLNIYEEIIIEPNQGVRLAMWFKEKEAITLRLLKKLDANSNLWLVTYDKSKYEPKVFLDLLKNDPSIKMAEFNKKAANRN